MKVVAVSQRIDQFSDRNETRDALDQRLINFLQSVGVIPVPVPNGLCHTCSAGQHMNDSLDAWLSAVKPQGFVLSGGNDIGQCTERDFTESRLLDHASTYQLPVLGICRGMQMMSYWAGTSLHPVQGHVRTRHHLSGMITGEVNSYHALSLMACPSGFEIMAQSQDGEIEAIRHISLPWEGWMWHPEREDSFDERDLNRVRALFHE
jgi:gamma-glutamyl-gamma-aminobutyrate hydrolase PuuD